MGGTERANEQTEDRDSGERATGPFDGLDPRRQAGGEYTEPDDQDSSDGPADGDR